MKLISIVVVLLMSFSANALEDMSLQGHLGFERSTAIIGADVDFQISSIQPEKDSKGCNNPNMALQMFLDIHRFHLRVRNFTIKK